MGRRWGGAALGWGGAAGCAVRDARLQAMGIQLFGRFRRRGTT